MCSPWLFLPCMTLFHTQNGFILLWYSSIFQDVLAMFSLWFIHIQHICAQYCMSSFLETIRNILTKSNFLRWTTIPLGSVSIVSRCIFLVLSGFTERFDFNRVKKCHCFFLIALRFSRERRKSQNNYTIG